jgi:hypothetical protein
VGADEQGEGLGAAQAGENSSEEQEGPGTGAAQAAGKPPAEAGAADPETPAKQLPAFGAPQEDAGQPAGQPEQSEWSWPVGVWLVELHAVFSHAQDCAACAQRQPLQAAATTRPATPPPLFLCFFRSGGGHACNGHRGACAPDGH